MFGQPRVAIVQQADLFELMRCHCAACLQLDRRYPGQGFQLTFFPMSIAERWQADALDRQRGRPA
jgi:hypothetical protein